MEITTPIKQKLMRNVAIIDPIFTTFIFAIVNQDFLENSSQKFENKTG